MRKSGFERLRRKSGRVLTIGASVVLVACGSQTTRVTCEGRLEPINVPAKRVDTRERGVSSATLVPMEMDP
jgi:hypothetical protein